MTPVAKPAPMTMLYDRLLDCIGAVAAVLVFAIMMLIGADVGFRYLFSRPFGWVLEFTEYGLLCILFLGMPWLVRERGHVAIELFVDALPSGPGWALRVASFAVAAAVSGVLAYWAIVSGIDSYQRGVQTFGIYPIPRFLLMAVVAAGLALTAVEFLRQAVRMARGGPQEHRHGGAPEITPPVG